MGDSQFGMEKTEFGGVFDLKTNEMLELWSIFCWLKKLDSASEIVDVSLQSSAQRLPENNIEGKK